MLARVGALFHATGALSFVLALGVTGALVAGSISNAAAVNLVTAPCTSVALAPSVASPTTLGTTVVWTASAAGCSAPLFQFWVLRPGAAWAVVQDWSTSSTFSWTTGGLAAGDYTIEVDAGVSAREATRQVSFTLSAPIAACTSVALSPNPSSPQAAGTSVLWTASAAGCTAPQFQFWLLRPGAAWAVVQDWSASSTFSWATTGLAAGDYTVEVDARASGASSAQATRQVSFTLTAATTAPCTSATLAANPASPQAAGTTVLFTATAAGCTSPQFRFWLLRPGAGWAVVQDWSTSATFSWTTTGLAAGDYTIEVDARAGGTGVFQASAQLGFTLTSSTTPPPSTCGDQATAIAFQIQRVNTAFAGFHTDLEKLRGLRDRETIATADGTLRLIRHAATKAIHATTTAACKKDDDEDEVENDTDDNDDNDHHDSDKSMDLSARATVLSFVEERTTHEDNDDHGRKPGLTFTGDAKAIADQAIAAMQVAFDTAKNAPVKTPKPTPTPRVENRSKPVLPTKSPAHHNGEHGDRD